MSAWRLFQWLHLHLLVVKATVQSVHALHLWLHTGGIAGYATGAKQLQDITSDCLQGVLPAEEA